MSAVGTLALGAAVAAGVVAALDEVSAAAAEEFTVACAAGVAEGARKATSTQTLSSSLASAV
jgi:hypothetical protein